MKANNLALSQKIETKQDGDNELIVLRGMHLTLLHHIFFQQAKIVENILSNINLNKIDVSKHLTSAS